MSGVELKGERIRLFDQWGREYVSVAQAAEISGLSENRIRGIHNEGHTPGAIKPGGRDLLLQLDELDEYLEKRKMGRPRKK